MDKFEDIILSQTFSLESKKLPHINKFPDWKENDIFQYDVSIDSFFDHWQDRKAYTNNSFIILTHELVSGIVDIMDDLKISSASEIMCGLGWLSHWINIYRPNSINQMVDNLKWGSFQGKYSDKIVDMDASEYVADNPNVDLFIMSWPRMDDGAINVWKNMSKGQYLLYFGESHGGCCATDEFFEETIESKVDISKIKNNFIKFPLLHDFPVMYEKF